MPKLCPMRIGIEGGDFKDCLEERCAWYDDETGECEITNLSLISKIPTEQESIRSRVEKCKMKQNRNYGRRATCTGDC